MTVVASVYTNPKNAMAPHDQPLAFVPTIYFMSGFDFPIRRRCKGHKSCLKEPPNRFGGKSN